MESELNEPIRMRLRIVIPESTMTLVKLIEAAGGEIYPVGGMIRDRLYGYFHDHDRRKIWTISDTDLATNLSEEEILACLRTEEAKKKHVTVKEKESVDTFGVVFAGVAGHGPFEIAPFRKDGSSSDGRRPDSVERGTIAEDAARRDLTMNSLYYDIRSREIIDFTGGIEDIQNLRVRMVGDPDKRFEEDKLRILRLVRFFNRYIEGSIVESLDESTLKAIEKYRDLLSYAGMSHERIQTEFLKGMEQCKSVKTYLQSYAELGLFTSVFPGCDVDLTILNHAGQYVPPNVVMAAILRKNEKISEHLNRLKYPNRISDRVQFLVDAWKFDTSNVISVLKARDKGLHRGDLTEFMSCQNSEMQGETNHDLFQWSSFINSEDRTRAAVIEHLAGFYFEPTSGNELIQKGYSGPQIGAFQREEIQANYSESLKKFLENKNL